MRPGTCYFTSSEGFTWIWTSPAWYQWTPPCPPWTWPDAPGPGVMDTPILASKTGNPFMEFCMRKLRVMNHSHLLPFLTVFFSTGPYFLSLTYLQYPCKETIHRIDTLYTRSLYFHHQHSASWQKWDYYLIKFFERYFLPLACVAVLAKILLPMRTRIRCLLMKLKIFGTLWKLHGDYAIDVCIGL